MYKDIKCFRRVWISGEFGSWVFAKKWIVWMTRAWINCWDGWEVFELTINNVGKTLSKKLDKFSLVYSRTWFWATGAALPITYTMIPCIN